MSVSRRHAVAMMAAASAMPWSVMAQDGFPNRPITMVVPYPPGASTDQVGRLTQSSWSQVTGGSTMVVENKGGAAGNVGSAYVAKSPPDGYRILLATQSVVTINPFLYKDMGFDPVKDLTPLTAAVNAVVALAVHPSVPANNMQELIEYGRRHRNALHYGTAGSGSPQHVGGLLLAQRADFGLTHIPYRGGGPMVTDLLAGHIQVGIVTLSAVKQFAAEGRLKILAIGERERFAGAPDIPTIAETVPGFELTTWLGYFAPAGLPRPIADYLSQNLIKALNTPDVKRQLIDLALPPRTEGPQALADLVQADRELYGRIIREHNITAS